jgi:hypothetical protein
MTRNSDGAWDRRRRVGWTLVALMALVAAWSTPPEAEAQTSRKAKPKAKPKPAATKEAEPKPADPKDQEPAEPVVPFEYETVKLADGTEMPVKKWGKTFAAYEYQPPIDILDKRVHVVLDSQRSASPRFPVTGLELDSQVGLLYWSEGLNSPRPIGRVMRSRLDGSGVHTLASDRIYPHSLVLDRQRGRIYWLEGVGESPSRLQTATLDGKETTLSRGLNNPRGLALDSTRGQLFYWENDRLMRIDVDGTGEQVVTANRRIALEGFATLAFDAAQDRLIGSMHIGGPRWLDKDGTHLQYLPRMDHTARIYGLAFNEEHRKVYFANFSQALQRANVDGTQIETLVASPAESEDGCSRTIAGGIAIDPERGLIYWSCMRIRGASMYPMIYRTELRPILKPTKRPAPPKVVTIAPSEHGAGGEIVLSGEGLADAVDVRFIDDSTGVHTSAKFHGAGQGRLTVTVPRLGNGCRRPVIVVQTPSGVTMTLGTDVIAPDHKPYQYEEVRTVASDKDPWWLWTNKPYKHERSSASSGARVWLRPGLIAGNVESAVVYAQSGSSVSFGPKGMVTAFAKDDSYVAVSNGLQYDEVIVYHEPFAATSYSTFYTKTVKLIPVPAIRPSFPETPFRYLAN